MHMNHQDPCQYTPQCMVGVMTHQTICGHMVAVTILRGHLGQRHANRKAQIYSAQFTALGVDGMLVI